MSECIWCETEGADITVTLERENGVETKAECHSECKEHLLDYIRKIHAESHGDKPLKIRDRTVS